jgi:hypothetical protein
VHPRPAIESSLCKKSAMNATDIALLLVGLVDMLVDEGAVRDRLAMCLAVRNLSVQCTVRGELPVVPFASILLQR